MTLLNIWNGGLILLPLIGFAVTGYCLHRWFTKRLIIPLVIGCFIGALSIIGIIALILDR